MERWQSSMRSALNLRFEQTITLQAHKFTQIVDRVIAIFLKLCGNQSN